VNQKTSPLPQWAYGVLSVAGVALVASMVLNWIDLGGSWSRTGIGLAWDENHWMLLVPLAGALLVAAASTRSEFTRIAAIFAGIVVTGYVLFDLSRSIIHSGLDTWLILGGAGVMLAGSSRERVLWRAAGGVLVLVGFFAPWTRDSLWKGLTAASGWDMGFTIRVLWLIPLAGVVGIISAGNARNGKALAIASGATIYGAFLWVIGSMAYLVFGMGAWAALAASTVALAIGVMARKLPQSLPSPSQDS